MLNKLYYLNVGPNGTFAPSGDPRFDSSPQNVDSIIKELKVKNQKKIVLYFHGGLVNQYSGMDSATRITHLINSTTQFHPISFVWETGLLETITSNLTEIYKTELFKGLVKKVLKIGGKKLGIDLMSNGSARGMGNIPDKEMDRQLRMIEPFQNLTYSSQSRSIISSQPDSQLLDELKEEVDADITLDYKFLNLIESEKETTEKAFLDLDKLSDTSEDNSRGIISTVAIVKALVKVIFRVIKRHVNQRDHGFYPTIVEEILREIYVANVGSYIWKQMKDKAENMWKLDAPDTSDLNKHVGSYFLHKLEEYNNEAEPLIIDVIGHSAGAIVISHLVDALQKHNSSIKIRNISLLAPACLCELFNTKVIQNKSRFSFLRIFTMSDSYEIKDKMLSIVYPRSLLYFISGLLENEGKESDAFILGLQRHISGFIEYKNEPLLQTVKEFLENTPNTVVYSITDNSATDGLRCIASKHGDFDNDAEATFISLSYLINI